MNWKYSRWKLKNCWTWFLDHIRMFRSYVRIKYNNNCHDWWSSSDCIDVERSRYSVLKTRRPALLWRDMFFQQSLFSQKFTKYLCYTPLIELKRSLMSRRSKILTAEDKHDQISIKVPKKYVRTTWFKSKFSYRGANPKTSPYIILYGLLLP